MRELTINEIARVSGGALELGTGLGGIFSPANVAAATRLLTGVGAAYAAWQFGWKVGTGIYNSVTFQRLSSP